eukprot:1189957-Prorocentrum_minimum.AAC.4
MLHTLSAVVPHRGNKRCWRLGATRQSPARCGAGPYYSRVPTLSPLRMRQSAGDCILSILALHEVRVELIEKIV